MAKNFTPNIEHSDLQGYSGQGAFRFWCQMCLPLVYDDTLSYYELLNKMVIYLNNVISDVATVETNLGNLNDVVNNNFNALLTAYNRLQNYVNNYFDNLDVQDEINNKLDDMALNGELTEVFNNFATTELWQPRLSTTTSTGCANLYINSAGGKVLIDCAESTQTSALGQLLSQKLNGDKLDCLVITHFDGDHAGGAPYVIQNFCDEDTVFIVGLDFDASYFGANGQRAGQNREAFYAAISAAGYDNNVVTATQGMIQRFGCIKLEFFNADPSFVSGYNTAHSDSGADTFTQPTINNFSLITYVYSSGITFLNAADVERPAQQNNKDFIKPCDIMQIPHHATNANGCCGFFQKANPKIGYFNYNTTINTGFRYLGRYRRIVEDFPVVSTETKGVYFKVANGCILDAEGTLNTDNERQEMSNIRYYLPFPQDETSEGWNYNNWAVRDIVNMFEFSQGKKYVFNITNSACPLVYAILPTLFDNYIPPSGVYFAENCNGKIKVYVKTNSLQTKAVYLSNDFDMNGDYRQSAVFKDITNTYNQNTITLNANSGDTLTAGTIPNNQFDYIATLSDGTNTKTVYCHHQNSGGLVGSSIRLASDGRSLVIWCVEISSNTVNAVHFTFNTQHGLDNTGATVTPCTLVSLQQCW